MTKGNVFSFPGSGQASVSCAMPPELTEVETDRLVEAVEAAAAAVLDCGSALRWIRAGGVLTPDNHVLNGEALHSLLSATLAISLLMGSRNSERPLQREIYSWIEKETTHATET
jgi:hypothetical protein